MMDDDDDDGDDDDDDDYNDDDDDGKREKNIGAPASSPTFQTSFSLWYGTCRASTGNFLLINASGCV